MTIAPDVTLAAQRWGLDPTWIQAVIVAEGDGHAFVRAVECSVPTVQNRAQAIEVLCRSLVHRYREFVHSRGEDAAFLAFFAGHWAPIGADNDPTSLNRHWLPNVRTLLGVSA